MSIAIRGARQHNLKDISLDIGPGLTVVTGVSGSGKTSLVFDTLYHEARRRFLEIYSLGSASARLAPANVDAITGLGPAVAVGQNLLNRNPNSTLATASGLHPFLRLLYAHFGERTCPACGARLFVYTEDELVERLTGAAPAAARAHQRTAAHAPCRAATAPCSRCWRSSSPRLPSSSMALPGEARHWSLPSRTTWS